MRTRKPKEQEDDSVLSRVGHLVSRIIGTDDEPKRKPRSSSISKATESRHTWIFIVGIALLWLAWLYFLPDLIPYITTITIPTWYAIMDTISLPLVLPWNLVMVCLARFLNIEPMGTIQLPSVSLRAAYACNCPIV